MAKLITVFGATGAQGGSVVEALLNDGGFKVRGVTRKPDSDAAKKLEAKGVEVVQGDIANDSVEQLAKLLAGSYGAFLLTNFWDPSGMMKEHEQGVKLVDAAKAAGVKHVQWSSLSNVEKHTHKYHVPHFTDKAKVQEYIESLQAKSPKAFDCVTFPAPAFYYQNFISFFPPKFEDGVAVFTLPEGSSITAFDVADTGAAVLAAFKNPEQWNNKRIDLAGTHASEQEFVDTYAKVTGKPAKLNAVPRDVFAKFPFTGAEELADMFGWFDEFTYYGPERDLESGRKAVPNLKTWEQWLQATGWTGEQK